MRRKMMILAVQLKFPSPKIKSIYRIKHNLSDRLLYHSQTKKNETRWINPIWCLPPFDSNFCPSAASRLITPNCFYASIYFALIAGAVKPANITPNWNHFTVFHLFGRLDIGLYYMQYITIHFFHPASGSTSQPWLWTISISSQLLQNVLQCYKSCDNWKHEGRLKMGWNKFASAQAEYKASIDLLI